MIARERNYTTPQECAPPEFDWPFESNGDLDTFTVTRTYKQTRAGFLADKLAGLYTPGKVHDAEHPDAWLVASTKPVATPTGLFQFTRTFARIPRTQISYGALRYSQPVVPGSTANRAYGVLGTANSGYFYQPDTNVSRFHAYSRKSVTSDQGVSNIPTGGTATLTHGADTTGNLAYNITAADLKTALNALASVVSYGSIATVSGNYNDAAGFLATFNYSPPFTFDTTNLTYSGALEPGYPATNDNINGLSHGLSIGTNIRTITGGTFTVTFAGQTSAAIAYNATAAAAEAIIDAMSSVIALGGCSVSTYCGAPTILYVGNSINFTVLMGGGAIPSFTGTSSLTPTPGSVTIIPVAGTLGRQQYIKFATSQLTRQLTIPAHGFTAGTAIFVKMGSTYYVGLTDSTNTSPDGISVPTTATPWNINTAITEAGLYSGIYESGPAGFSIIKEEAYWLPGVSPGVATALDLPARSAGISDAAFLDAIVSGAASLVYDETEQKNWLGPIVSRTKTTLLLP